jgi:hypothetical protein
VRQIDISVSLVVVVCVVTSFRIRGIRHQTLNTPPRSEERKRFLIEHINHSYSRLEMSIFNAQRTHMRVDVINL